jgi:hypothetical protein
MRSLDILSVVIGCGAIAFGLWGNRFYAGLIRPRREGEAVLPRWFGRLWFIVCGIVAISNGIWRWF